MRPILSMPQMAGRTLARAGANPAPSLTLFAPAFSRSAAAASARRSAGGLTAHAGPTIINYYVSHFVGQAV